MKKAVLHLMVVIFLIGLAGCASGPNVRILQAEYPKTPVYVMEMSFEKYQHPKDWESDEKWDKHVSDWKKAFKKALGQYVKEAQFVDSINAAKNGIIVKPCVTDIKRNFNHFTGGTDYILYDAELIVGATKKTAAVVEIKGDSSGAGYAVYTFGGRMEACAVSGAHQIGRYIRKELQSEK